jgi:hypothetical protein
MIDNPNSNFIDKIMKESKVYYDEGDDIKKIKQLVFEREMTDISANKIQNDDKLSEFLNKYHDGYEKYNTGAYNRMYDNDENYPQTLLYSSSRMLMIKIIC